jgi:hypothetical protein
VTLSKDVRSTVKIKTLYEDGGARQGATLPTDKWKKVGEILIFRIPKTLNAIVVLNVRIGMGSCGVVCVCPKALCVRVFHAALGRKAIRNRFAAAFVSECEKLRVQLYPAPPATRSPDFV